MRSGCRPAGDDEVAVGQHLIDGNVQIGEGRHVDIHELSEALRSVHGGRECVTLRDELLIDGLHEAVGIVGAPGIHALPSDPEILLFGHDASPTVRSVVLSMFGSVEQASFPKMDPLAALQAGRQ